MAKKTYQVKGDDITFTTHVGAGKLIQLASGDTYETDDEDEQRELDAAAALDDNPLESAKAAAKAAK